MQQNEVKAGYVAGIVSTIAVVLMTIGAEFSPEFKNLLANLFTHHWIGKGVIAIALFLLIFFLFRNKELKSSTLEKLLITSVILGYLAILLFFIIHFFQN